MRLRSCLYPSSWQFYVSASFWPGVAVGALRVNSGDMSIEVLLMVLMAGVEAFRPQRDLRTLLHDGMVGLSAAQGIFELLEAKPVVTWRGSVDVTADASVAFDGVSFAYPGGRAAAHVGLDFKVADGERVGFVGSSGAGKSTIVKLLLRFHDPEAGCVRVGSRDVRELSPEALYRNVAVVSQDTYLFHGTVEGRVLAGVGIRHSRTLLAEPDHEVTARWPARSARSPPA